MKSYGIIGFPLTHSFSRQYFTEKIEAEKITDSIFQVFPLSSIESFPTLLKENPLLRGLSVTIPYKEQVLQFVQYFSDEVLHIGATNCIKINNGILTAYNTDIIGFEESFVKTLQPHHKKALVLGTGGASKAVQYVLKKLGIGFLVVSRIENSEAGFIPYQQVTKNLIAGHQIIINTTPLGMSPNEDGCPNIPYTLLTAQHYLYDLVYKPVKTLFMQKGEQQGAFIKNGFEMLIIQAEANWKIWNAD